MKTNSEMDHLLSTDNTDNGNVSIQQEMELYESKEAEAENFSKLQSQSQPQPFRKSKGKKSKGKKSNFSNNRHSHSHPQAKVQSTAQIKTVDLEIEGDGIDDARHNEEVFMKIVGTGNPNIAPPTKNSKTWPALPHDVSKLNDCFFREPDLIASTDSSNFKTNFVEKVNQLGWHKQKAIWQVTRHVFGTFLLSCTGVGIAYNVRSYAKVEPNEIGFYKDFNDNAYLLYPGHHYRPNPTHSKIVKYPLDEPRINFIGRAHIIRVKPGEYVVGKSNDQYVLLKPSDSHIGVHMFDDPNFKFVERIKQTKKDISYGPINIITVEPGKLCTVEIENKPFLLFPGKHFIESGNFKLGENSFKNQNKSFDFGVIHHYYVKPGEVGMIKIGPHAGFISKPGGKFFYTPEFASKPPANPQQRIINFNPLSRVLIDDTSYGLIQDEGGVVRVLEGGKHIIELPNIYLDSLPSQTFHVIENMTATTADPLDVKFVLSMSYKIQNPIIAYTVCKTLENIQKAVKEQAKTTISTMVRNLRVEETLLKYNIKEQDNKAKSGEAALAQWQEISVDFVVKLAKNLLENYGVYLNVKDWGCQNFDLANQQQQDELSKAVYERAKAESRKVELINQREMAKITSEKVRIDTQTKAQKDITDAETKKQISEIDVSIKAQRDVVNAQTREKISQIEVSIKEQEIERLTKAEAQKIITIARAKKTAHELFPHSVDLEKVGMIADAFKKSNLFISGDGAEKSIAPILYGLSQYLGNNRQEIGDDPNKQNNEHHKLRMLG